MKFLSIILFFVLAAIAGLHAYWGLGGLWPAASEIDLVKTVIGAPEWTRMPPMLMTLAVAGLIFTSGVVALSAGGVLSLAPEWLTRLGAGVLALIFIGRGLVGYSAAFSSPARAEPFATLNFWYYSPLCLAIGSAFIVLLFMARSSSRERLS